MEASSATLLGTVLINQVHSAIRVVLSLCLCESYTITELMSCVHGPKGRFTPRGHAISP